MRSVLLRACALVAAAVLPARETLGLLVEKPCCDQEPHMPAAFGPVFSGESGVGGVLHMDMAARFMCDSDMGFASNMAGKIAFIQRGYCRFVDKVLHAQLMGAKGVVVYNPEEAVDGTMMVKMSVDDPEEGERVSIPAVFVSYDSGIELERLMAANPDGVRVFINGTDEFNPEDLDPSPIFLKSVLFLLQLMLVVWSIVAVFSVVSCVHKRLARRKRLLVVRKLPTRVYRAPQSQELEELGECEELELELELELGVPVGTEVGSELEVEPDGEHLALRDGGDASRASRHPRHPGHRRVPVEDVEIELQVLRTTGSGVTDAAVAPLGDGQDARASASSASASAAASSTPGPSAATLGRRGASNVTDYFASENCVICICDFEDGETLTVLPCGHGYHKECVEPWLIRRIETIEEFIFRAKELTIQEPSNVRYTLKYVGGTGQLSAKMTDNTVCLTHKTDRRADVYQFESLNEWYLSACTGVKRPRFESEAPAEDAETTKNNKKKKTAAAPASAKAGASTGTSAEASAGASAGASTSAKSGQQASKGKSKRRKGKR